jgi:hypothetical protein
VLKEGGIEHGSSFAPSIRYILSATSCRQNVLFLSVNMKDI